MPKTKPLELIPLTPEEQTAEDEAVNYLCTETDFPECAAIGFEIMHRLQAEKEARLAAQERQAEAA